MFLPGLAAAFVVLRPRHRPIKKARLVGTLVLSAILLHGMLPGFRWQMVPASVLMVGVGIVLLAEGGSPSRILSQLVFRVVFFGAFAMSIGLNVAFPLFRLPEPTGPCAIGTRYLEVIDSSRDEVLTSARGDSRELYIQAWYPASTRSGPADAPYLQDAGRASRITAKAKGLGFLPFLWSHLGFVETHASLDAPISTATAEYPVVLFSHGYGQVASFNTALTEELASYGYVVLGLYHTHETPFVIDESLVARPSAGDVDERSIDSSGSPIAQLRDTTRLAELDEMLQHLYRDAVFLADRTNSWAEDLLFVKDIIPSISEEHFDRRLRSDRVAVAGWSYGGGAAGVAMLVDSTIAAGVNVDAFQYGHLLPANLQKPFLFLMCEGHGGENQYFLDRAEADVYRLTVEGAGHSSFTDLAVSAEIPARIAGQLGSLDGTRGIEITRRYLVGFLDCYVKGKASDLLKGPSPDFPEIEFEARRQGGRTPGLGR